MKIDSILNGNIPLELKASSADPYDLDIEITPKVVTGPREEVPQNTLLNCASAFCTRYRLNYY